MNDITSHNYSSFIAKYVLLHCQESPTVCLHLVCILSLAVSRFCVTPTRDLIGDVIEEKKSKVHTKTLT